MPKCSGVILAGGKSQRLGMDKSQLKLNGKWLLERILNILATLSDDLLIITEEKPKFAQLAARIVPDICPGMGPLGGIYSGLQAMHYHYGLFVACDMPLLNPELLQYLVRISTDFDAVIPRIAGKTEPLHAIYSKACIRPIMGLLARGELRIAGFFSQVRVRYVEEDEIDAFDPKHLSFFNINTRSDLKIAQKLLKYNTISRKTELLSETHLYKP